MSSVLQQKKSPDFHHKNLYFVGRNFGAHAKELNNPIPETPVLFSKPLSSLVKTPATWELDAKLGGVEAEAELVLELSAQGTVQRIGLGFDMTARQIQSELKAKSLPWFLAKSRRAFTVVGPLLDWTQPISELGKLEFSALANNVLCQKGSVNEMIFSPQTVIDYLKLAVDFEDGDLLFTGTPAGARKLQSGDVLRAVLHQFSYEFSLRIV